MHLVIHLPADLHPPLGRSIVCADSDSTKSDILSTCVSSLQGPASVSVEDNYGNTFVLGPEVLKRCVLQIANN